MVESLQASGSDSLRAYVTMEYIKGSPFKIAVATAIGIVFGCLGALLGRFTVRLGEARLKLCGSSPNSPSANDANQKEMGMRIIKLTAITMVCFVMASPGARSQGQTTPLSQFRGDYQIVSGPAGTVRVADALGGSYTEWSVSVGQPAHELRMLVGAPNADGTFRVWRFEQEPSPAVSHEGRAQLNGQEFIADFLATNGPAGKMIRERWTLIPKGGLQFALEASGQGETPQRVGGFMATRR